MKQKNENPICYCSICRLRDRCSRYQKTEIECISNKNIKFIKDVILEVMGISFDEYVSVCRKRDLLYAKMIFSRYAYIKLSLKCQQIADLLNKTHATIIYYLHKFDDEYKYNREFADIVNQVEFLYPGTLLMK